MAEEKKGLWGKMDGKKTLVGWLITQLPILGFPNLIDSWQIAITSIAQAAITKDVAPAVDPTFYALGQTLLAVGVAHGFIKNRNAKATSSSGQE